MTKKFLLGLALSLSTCYAMSEADIQAALTGATAGTLSSAVTEAVAYSRLEDTYGDTLASDLANVQGAAGAHYDSSTVYNDVALDASGSATPLPALTNLLQGIFGVGASATLDASTNTMCNLTITLPGVFVDGTTPDTVARGTMTMVTPYTAYAGIPGIGTYPAAGISGIDPRTAAMQAGTFWTPAVQATLLANADTVVSFWG